MKQAKRQRRSIRIKGYDYTQPGAYFLTLCTHERSMLFGDLINDQLVANEYGRIVREEWLKSADIRDEIVLDEFVIMPNHLHGIVWIMGDTEGADGRPPLPFEPTPSAFPPSTPADAEPTRLQRTPRSLGAFVAGFKSAVTTRINRLRDVIGMPVWQRNYYEHVIRSESALFAIRRYIVENPLRWTLDHYHLEPAGPDPRAVEIWRLLHSE